MFTNNKIAKAISLAMAFGTVSGLSLSTAAFAQDADAEAKADKKIEKIQVTGSRIKRADMEGALPVTVIDRAAIEFSGQTSVADLLRNTSFNSTGSFRPQSGSSAQGVSQINLRGLGASRTLVLLDGRRLATSPSTGSSQDLNSIPAAAVERVEILSDGASAAYGSDAIGGVINIITRKDFNGVELKLGAAQIEHEGGDREEGSVVIGTASDRGSIIGGVSWNSRDIIFARDFPWAGRGGSTYSNNIRTLAGTPADQAFSYTAVPGGCSEGDFYTIPFSSAAANSAGVRERCGFDFAAVSADEASTSNVGFFMNSKYEINDEWLFFSNMSITKTSSFGRYAPSLAATILPAESPNNPTNPDANSYDPAFGDNVDLRYRHRFAALGNRDSEVDNELQDILLGIEGEFGDMFIDFGIRRNKAKTYDIGRNYVVIPIADQFIASGEYDIQKPFDNDASILNAMKATISRVGISDQDEIFGSAQFDLGELDGGAITAVVGGEWRSINYIDQYDSLSEAGVIGGSAGNSAGGTRISRAAFAEVLLPFSEALEVTVAGRYDSFSDYGSDFSPKVSLRYTPVEDLVLRASWGKGFRAPTLDIITQKDAFSADSVTDAVTCAVLGSCPVQISATVVANPSLESENSTQFAFGIAYEPLENLSFSIDYYNIEIENRITGFSSQGLIDRQLAGDPIPAGLGVTRDSITGAVSGVTRGFGNEGTQATSGVDMNVQYLGDFDDLGSLRTTFQIGYIIDFDINKGRNRVDDFGLPQYRGILSNVYSIGDFDIVWNINFIASTSEFTDGDGQQGHVPSWVTNDLQFNYNTAWDGKVTVGSSNIFAKEPPLFPSGSRDYNFDLYDGYGRIVYVRYTQTF